MDQLLVFVCHILFELIIVLAHFIVLRYKLLILNRKWWTFRFQIIKLIFDIIKFIGKQNNLFNFFFNLLLMIRLNLSEPFIDCLIIFLNNARNHSFIFHFSLLHIKFDIVWQLINLSFLNLNWKRVAILILMRLGTLSSLFTLFRSLC